MIPEAGTATTRRASRTVAGSIALAAALVLAPAVSSFGAASSSPMLAPHVEAGRQVDALRAAQPQSMPRLADAAAATALRVLADDARFLGTSATAPSDLGAVSDLCDRDRALMVDYLVFGAMREGRLSGEVMARNAVFYQDEIALLQGFVARCIARQVPLAEDVLRQLGEAQASRLRLGGVRRGQAALLQVYVVVAAHCPVDSAPDAAYCRLLDTLADVAPVHARALPLASRASIGALLMPLRERASGERQQRAIGRILDAMGDVRCVGLCLLQPA